jgi:integrase
VTEVIAWLDGRRHWKPVVVAAELPDGLRFHDLRNTCASILIARGAHPKEIQARLGRASIMTTMDRYGHLFPSLGRSWMTTWNVFSARRAGFPPKFSSWICEHFRPRRARAF